MLEIEVKIKIRDLAPFREKLHQAGASLDKERTYEETTLYDFPSQTLFKKREAVRLRKMGKKAYFAFKGAPQKSRRFKVREEHETEVKNAGQAENILRSLGLKPVFSYKKYRTVYRKGRLKICLDETPVGNYCEMEGGRSDITKFAKALGVSSKELIKADYVQLFKEAREKR